MTGQNCWQLFSTKISMVRGTHSLTLLWHTFQAYTHTHTLSLSLSLSLSLFHLTFILKLPALKTYVQYSSVSTGILFCGCVCECGCGCGCVYARERVCSSVYEDSEEKWEWERENVWVCFLKEWGRCVFVYVCVCVWEGEKERERERERERGLFHAYNELSFSLSFLLFFSNGSPYS